MLYFTRIHFAINRFPAFTDCCRKSRFPTRETRWYCPQCTSLRLNDELCSAFYGRCKRDTARICCCGAVAAGRRPCSNRSISPACPPGPQRQTRRTLPTVRTDRWTDGRTPYHYTVPAAHSCDQCQPCKLKVRTSNFLFGSFSWFTQTVRN